MNSDSLRQNSRRQDMRRKHERRIITFTFGSKEWLDMIKKHYFLWPKQDQRLNTRRNNDRRKLERRNKNSGRELLNKQIEKTVEALTDEEIQVLNGLWTR